MQTPPVNRMTDRCKNITLATTSLRPVITNLTSYKGNTMFRNFLFVSTMPYIPYYLLGANDNSFIMKMLPLTYNCIRLLFLCKFTMSRPITMYISFPPFLNIHPNLSNTFYMEQKKQLSRIHQNIRQGTFSLLATHEPFLVVDSERFIIHIW